jgi:hypothetical protein
MKCIALTLSIFPMIAVQSVQAHDNSECIGQNVDFDGLSPLRYGVVSQDSAPKMYLHREYPAADCTPADEAACKSSSYLVPGDKVAIAKSCGPWAYIQYLGDARISVGWVDKQHLIESKEELRRQSASSAEGNSHHYPFKLTKGKNTPVCEAYLQRMNQTNFTEPPYCGRPEADIVPGFAFLQRHWMDRADYIHLYVSVNSFLENRSVETLYVHRKGSDGKDIFGPPSDEFLPASYLPSVWLYDSPIDIENNGVRARVAIWNEDDRSHPSCLEYVGNTPTPSRSAQWGVILQPDNIGIDAERTKVVFGHPDGGILYRTGPQAKGPLRLDPVFRAIGSEVGIFVYRGVTYYDTFFRGDDLGDFYDRRKNDKGLRNVLGVFVRKKNKTQQICEYDVSGQGD